MSETKIEIGKRLAIFRKSAKLTQIEVAEKLNYSDKAVSKWERGESVPDISVLQNLAVLYNVTIEEIVSGTPTTPVTEKTSTAANTKHALIILMSVLLVWVIATIVFVATKMALFSLPKVWLAFVFAFPVSLLVAFILACVWANNLTKCALLSAFIWTIVAAFFLTFPKANTWLLFLLPIPFQALILVWFFFRSKIIKLYKHLTPKLKNKTGKQDESSEK